MRGGENLSEVLNKDYKEPILLTVYDKASYWG
jgi:hypothetical protein